MKRAIFIYLCGLLAMVTFYACGTNDKDLKKEVDSVMVAYPGVTTTVDKGVVTLTGTVTSEDMKAGAERAAKAINHVKSVRNNIMVNAPSSSWTLPQNDEYDLIQSINDSLEDGGFDDINVSVSDGEVRLSGVVKKSDLQRVMQIANESGAKRVINEMTIQD